MSVDKRNLSPDAESLRTIFPGADIKPADCKIISSSFETCKFSIHPNTAALPGHPKDLLVRLQASVACLDEVVALQKLAQDQLSDLVPPVVSSGNITTVNGTRAGYTVSEYCTGTLPLEDVWGTLDQKNQRRLIEEVVRAVEKVQAINNSSIQNLGAQSDNATVGGPKLGYFSNIEQFLGGMLRASVPKPPNCTLREVDGSVVLKSDFEDVGQVELTRADLDDLKNNVVFCHNDLEPRNILVRPSTESRSPRYDLAAIVDWEMAGFFPFAYEIGWKDIVLGESNLSFSCLITMSGYHHHYNQDGFNPQFGAARSHSRNKRTSDSVSDDDGYTKSPPKRPRLLGAASDQPDYAVTMLSHEAYTVGWVTGQYGTNSAAVVANNMRWSFPSIHIGLMVGIGGGVPGKVDVRLGDVAVSNPTGGSSGVIQYDFGKAVHDGRFERTGTLNKPPQSVLTAVSELRAIHETRPNRIPAILAHMEMRNPYMSEYLYKRMDGDRLFEPSYEHASGDTCDDCDMTKVVEREPRPEAHMPKIHYGIIASGNQVMKHAQTRDRLAKDLGLVCFEMEAAGLMDNFPCLVVRGICDYSDSHKAKRWQRYAAATAAAYAKELLYVITPHENHGLTTQTVVAPGTHTVPSPPPPFSSPSPDHRKILLASLKFDQIDKRQANIKTAHAETCLWLAKHPDYTAWMDRQRYSQHHGFLWIKGKPGAGKSTLMKFAFSRAKKRKGKGGSLISFFFNARGEGLEKSTLGMYRSLLHQLLESMPELRTLLDDPGLTPLTQPVFSGWDLGQLKTLFRNAVRGLGRRQLTCFIDALDECDDNEVSDMVRCFEDLGQYAVQNDIRFYVCFSSRHYPYIDILYGRKLVLESQVGHEEDLADYVRSELRAGSGPRSDEVVAEILRKASGVFMWVVLVVDILNKEYGKGRLFAVKKRLEDIPSELSKLFQDILTRDQEDMGDLLLCTQLLLYSQRPLTREEYYFAIASGLQLDTLGEWDPEEITHEFMDRLIVSSSKGLAETTRSDDSTVQFIHMSRGKVAERFPFLEYATNQVLYHADAAAARGISQNGFLESFAVDDWIQMNNLFERTKVRRHKPASTSLLYIAAARGLTGLVVTSLGRNPGADIIGGRHKYPLLAAMSEGHETIASALLDAIADKAWQNEADGSSGYAISAEVQAEDHSGKTPLFYAARYLQMACLDILLSHGADINHRDDRGRTLLFEALHNRSDRSNAFQRFLDKRPDLTITDRSGQTTLLELRDLDGHNRKLLVKAGVDGLRRNNNGQTFLHVACSTTLSRPDEFRVLLQAAFEQGYDINTRDYTGRTPLLEAVKGDHASM
ncbi:Vegetative incompatibility protein HET-E-1, partial [Colletotrichum shisoi]